MATQERRPIGGAVKAAALSATPAVPNVADVMPPTDTPPDPALPDNGIVPVDTESADYKAGYQNAVDGVDAESENYRAGYAAGLGSTGAKPADSGANPPPPAGQPPAASAIKSDPSAPAKVGELRALAPDDNAFCMDCLSESLTLTQATAKFATKVAADLKTERTARVAAENARTAAEQALAAEQGSPPPVRLAKGNGTAAAAADANDPKVVAKAEWDADADLRATFKNNETNFIGLRVAELSGKFRQNKAG